MFSTIKKYVHNAYATKWERKISESSISFYNSKNKDIENRHLVYGIQINVCNNQAAFVGIVIFCNKFHPQYAQLREKLKKAGFYLEHQPLYEQNKTYWEIDTSNLEQCKTFINIVNQFEPLEKIQDEIKAFLKSAEETLAKKSPKKWQFKGPSDYKSYYNKNHTGIINKNLVFGIHFNICNSSADAIHISINCHENHAKYSKLCDELKEAGFCKRPSLGWSIETTDISMCKTFLEKINEFEPLEDIYPEFLQELNNQDLPPKLKTLKKWVQFNGNYFENETMDVGIDKKNILQSIEIVSDCDDEKCEGCDKFQIILEFNEEKSNYNDICKTLVQAGFLQTTCTMWVLTFTQNKENIKLLEVIDGIESLDNIRKRLYSIVCGNNKNNNNNSPISSPTFFRLSVEKNSPDNSNISSAKFSPQN